MRCLENQKLCILRGQAIEISIPVIEQDRQPADLAGATTEFGLSASPSQPYEHVVSTVVEGNTITATISSALSAQLDRGMYYFSRSEEHTSELQSRGHLVCRHQLQ